MAAKIFVGNLDTGVSEKDLHDAFATYGTVDEVRLIKDDASGRPCGYGFVTMPSGAEAMKAIGAWLHVPFKGRRLIINEALPNEEWFSGPMKDLGLTDRQWAYVEGYEKLLVERKLLRSTDDARLQALLWYAVDFGSAAHLQRVLAAGANPNMVFARGGTPLGRVIESSHPPDSKPHRIEIVQLLLEAGADPNQPSEGRTPLVIAGKIDTSIVRLLLAASARTSPAELNTVLLDSAAQGDSAMVDELLARGASVRHRGKFESLLTNTPVSALMVACLYAHTGVVQTLLAAGAEVNLKDGEGHTALDYAALDPKRSRKVIALLEKAGAFPAMPFPQEDDEATRGFAAAARKPAFKQAIARMKELTQAKSKPLSNAERKIPGGYGFLFEASHAETFVEKGAEYFAVGDHARKFVEEHQAEMRALNAYLFHTRDLTDVNGRAVALLPTVDVFRVVAAVGTEGPNSNVYNEDLIAWLRELEKDQPFIVTGLGADFIEGRFTTPIQDPQSLAKRINAICPNEDPGADVERRQIERLCQTNQWFLWWD